MLVSFVANLAALTCIGIAGYLANQQKAGWGWFLCIGLLCTSSVTHKSDKN